MNYKADLFQNKRHTGVSFGECWEMIGFKDYFDFAEADE